MWRRAAGFDWFDRRDESAGVGGSVAGGCGPRVALVFLLTSVQIQSALCADVPVASAHPAVAHSLAGEEATPAFLSGPRTRLHGPMTGVDDCARATHIVELDLAVVGPAQEGSVEFCREHPSLLKIWDRYRLSCGFPTMRVLAKLPKKAMRVWGAGDGRRTAKHRARRRSSE